MLLWFNVRAMWLFFFFLFFTVEKNHHHKTICCFKDGVTAWIISPPCFFYYYVFTLCPRRCLIGKDEIVFWSFTLSQCKKSSVNAVTASSGFRLHLETTSRQKMFPSSGWGERGMGSQVKRRKADFRKKGGKYQCGQYTHTVGFGYIIREKSLKLFCILACRQCASKVILKL